MFSRLIRIFARIHKVERVFEMCLLVVNLNKKKQVKLNKKIEYFYLDQVKNELILLALRGYRKIPVL